MTHRSLQMIAAGSLVVLLAGCGRSTAVSSSTAASTPVASTPVTSASASAADALSSGAAPSTAAAEQYCVSKGGDVQQRTASWGTNGDRSNWLPLAGSTQMCRFQSDDEAQSRIYVDLTTLSSSEPTLAVLAYLSKVPMPASTGGANPATGYCSKELGGSSTFGAVGASGGGWVATNDPDDVVVSLCVFPDLSFIDEWGLAYHSDGAIRGTDLAAAMAYRPDTLPSVYPVGTAAPTS